MASCIVRGACAEVPDHSAILVLCGIAAGGCYTKQQPCEEKTLVAETINEPAGSQLKAELAQVNHGPEEK